VRQTGNAAHLVFVTHHGKDAWIAKQIAREVQQRGAVVFLAELDTDLGRDYEDQLLDALNLAGEVVVLVTLWALARPYVWAELGAAWARRIPIIGLLSGITMDELQARPEVPQLLKRAGLLDLNDIERYLVQLSNRVGASTPVKE
jgi:hypothetical protein